MRKKKKEFRQLKSGQFFRQHRILYIKINSYTISSFSSAVKLSNGYEKVFAANDLVTPVKVGIHTK